jgi:hypothetical protein
MAPIRAPDLVIPLEHQMNALRTTMNNMAQRIKKLEDEVFCYEEEEECEDEDAPVRRPIKRVKKRKKMLIKSRRTT